MQALIANPVMFAFSLSGRELIMLFLAILILSGAKYIPKFGQGLRDGIFRFRKACEEVDLEAHDAGKSLGGVYGKPAAQALTADNQTAEIYDLSNFKREKRERLARRRMKFQSWSQFWRMISGFIFKLFN
jgi:Sec-independent protein translocase protein TatA